MSYSVSAVKYEKPFESLNKAIALCDGLRDLSPNSKVFIKPNLVVWYEGVNFPKYGVLTTSRLIEDMVRLLNEHGIGDISIVEGLVESEKTKYSMLELAAKGMGLDVLKTRYGVKIIDVMKGSFTRLSLDDRKLSVNTDILNADYFINMPVLKTHSQAMVSLGIKNLKGLLSIPSRKECHNPDRSIDLDYHLSRFLDILSPDLTIIDGIYSLERGPLINGTAHRSNVIIVSNDPISADKVGATILGFKPHVVPHISMAAKRNERERDLSDISIRGDVDIKKALKPHNWEWEQNKSGDLPLFFEKAGIKGIRYPKMDNTMCTYCVHFINYVVMGILMAKNESKCFDDIEILYGKIHKPTPGHKHTLLVGQCQVKLNSDNSLINHCVKIPGCPAKKKGFLVAFQELGIELPEGFMTWMEKSPELIHMKKYEGRAEFDPSFYTITEK